MSAIGDKIIENCEAIAKAFAKWGAKDVTLLGDGDWFEGYEGDYLVWFPGASWGTTNAFPQGRLLHIYCERFVVLEWAAFEPDECPDWLGYDREGMVMLLKHIPYELED